MSNEPMDANINEVSVASTGNEKENSKNENSRGQLSLANLPSLLKKVIEVFKDGKERKLAMYSTIVSLSGIFTRVSGSYKQKTCFPNMGFMALAPPASSKSVMMYPKTLIQPIQQYFLKKSQQALKEYMRLPKKGPNARGNPPPYKVVFIPANSSSSKILQHLSDNSPDTPAIIIESEMDTLSITNASDYGNYSDIMRKALENEPLSLSRRMNNEYIDVECPKVAIILSGTPGQVFKFIRNREDGLLSRFLVMSYNNNQGWRSVSPCPDCINLTDYFRELSEDYFAMWEFNSIAELKVTLSSHQISEFETVDFLFIFDEFDNIKDTEVRSNFADIIKAFSDNNTNATIVLVGIADDVEALIGNHMSLERCLKQIKMPCMSIDECTEIVEKGLNRLEISITPKVKKKIVEFSSGFPHYIHLLCKYGCEEIIEDERDEFQKSDLAIAIAKGIENTSEKLKSTYIKATIGLSTTNKWTDLLSSCGEAELVEFNCFSISSILKAYTRRTGKNVKSNSISYNLNQLCLEERGKILEKRDTGLNTRYRFSNAMMMAYIKLMTNSK